MIDFHCHILPGVDHGSNSLSNSLKQLEIADKYSISTIVCTSHFYPYKESVAEFLSRRDEGYELLKEKNPTNITLIKGAEVMLTMDLAETEGVEKLCIEGTNSMLVEMPDMIHSTWIYDVLLKLRDKKISPVIAHIDRYPDEVAQALLDMDLKIQANAISFVKFSKRRKMMGLVELGLIHVLGSDLHGANEKAYKDFLKAKSKLGVHFNKMQNNAKKILKI